MWVLLVAVLLLVAPTASADTGRVFDDLDGNGAYTTHEPPVPGATVQALNADGAAVGAAASPDPATGRFQLDPPPAATQVRASRPGYTPMTRDIVPANDNLGNFGLFAPNGVLQGTMCIETNGQAGCQFGQDQGLEGPAVTASGTFAGQPWSRTDLTSFDGVLLIPVVVGTALTLSAPAPAGFTDVDAFPPALPGVTEVDARTVSIGATVVEPGETIQPFGFSKTGSSVSGKLFSDRHGDGVLDSNEVTLPDLDVTATGPGGFVKTVTTNIDGLYVITGLPPGRIVVTAEDIPYATPPAPKVVTAGGGAIGNIDIPRRFPTLAGVVRNVFTGAPVAGALVTMHPTGQQQTTNGAGAFHFFDARPTAGLVVTPPTGYAAGASVAGSLGGAAGVGTVTGIAIMGRAPAGTGYVLGIRRGEVRGRVCVDADEDGMCGAGEPPLAGVDVTAGATTVQSGGDGRYIIGDLAPGVFAVSAQTPGYVAPAAVDVSIAGPTTTLVRDIAAVGATIGGRARDNRGDPVEDVTITLSGDASRTATTAADGTFAFRGLRAGTYTLTETQPSAYGAGSATAGPSGGTPDGPNAISAITVAPGADVSGHEFLDPRATVAGTVASDVDRDGIADADEAGIARVTVALSRDAQTTLRRTNAAGRVSFDGLLAGTYYATIKVPDGYELTGPTQRVVDVAAGEVNPVSFTLVGPAPSAPQIVSAPPVVFTLPEDATAECAVDGGDFAACASPVGAGLGPGEHTVTVRAVREGHRSEAVSRSFVVPEPPAAAAPATAAAVASPPVSRSARVLVGRRVRVVGRRLVVGCGVDAGAVRRCTIVVRHGGRLLARATAHGDGFRTAVAQLRLRRAPRSGRALRVVATVRVTPERGRVLTAKKKLVLTAGPRGRAAAGLAGLVELLGGS